MIYGHRRAAYLLQLKRTKVRLPNCVTFFEVASLLLSCDCPPCSTHAARGLPLLAPRILAKEGNQSPNPFLPSVQESAMPTRCRLHEVPFPRSLFFSLSLSRARPQITSPPWFHHPRLHRHLAKSDTVGDPDAPRLPHRHCCPPVDAPPLHLPQLINVWAVGSTPSPVRFTSCRRLPVISPR
jgi:hypothetical protein